MTYFNTTHEPENQVKIYTKINNGQDKRILEIIQTLNKPFSASIIWQKYIHMYYEKPTPITSVRRSINTLKNAGKICETGNLVQGMYGRSELEYIYVK